MPNVIPFPTVPPFAFPRKRGAQSDEQKAAHIASYRPRLIEDVELGIVSGWRRGVAIAWLAKMHQLTVRQTEAVIWCYQNFNRPAPASVREWIGRAA